MCYPHAAGIIADACRKIPADAAARVKEENMKLYLAPLEGITGWIYRNAQHMCFGGFDKYFIPFISPNQHGHFSSREKKDVMPENNKDMYAVPQVLTNQSGDFLYTVRKLKEYYGYDEVNLNLGCPSKTVVTKCRGAGFLGDPGRLERFLDDIFEKSPAKVSVKTRLGMEDPEEFEKILEIYNKFPFEEVIIHPRVQKDFYKNKPDMSAFSRAFTNSRNPVCYNGDIKTADDCLKIMNNFPGLECVMTGRGVLENPALGREIKGGEPASVSEIRKFHDLLYEGYCREMSGDRTILFKMKEMWSYLSRFFPESQKYAKKIKKCEKCRAYEAVVDEFFALY